MDCFTILMEHEVTVQGQASGTDVGGGTTAVYSDRATGVKCLLRVEGTGEEELFGQIQMVQTVTAALFYTSSVRGDKLVVTAGPSLVGATLHVTSNKDQPGVAALGFDEIVHLVCKRFL